MNPRQVEILAPAGSYESMVAAIAAGADAIYIGGSRFGARAYAENPGEDRLLEAIDYAHLHGCSIYMTVNTLVKEEELGELFDYIKPYYEQGLDAVIVQDMGVFSYIQRHFPNLPIHASTQMTITGPYGAKMLADLGASRIVTARELSLEEIARIREQTDVEIESFVHGALCYCYSGQCLMSSMIGGRSGNRGRCAQTCRLPYDVKKDNKVLNPGNRKYVLSLKDLCTLDIIPDMIEAGVYSMKIEGRMKSPRYTAGVVSIYRKYVDRYLKEGRKGYHVDQEDRQTLLDLFDRGGLTEGYYTAHNGSDMVVQKEKPSFRQGNEALFRYLDETYVEAKKQEPVEGTLWLKEGEPVRLQLACREQMVEVQGDVVQPAQRQPMTEEKLEKQMRKTGNTPFFFEKLECYLEGNLFLPVQALNELRRTGLEQLEKAILQPYHRTSRILASVSGKTEVILEKEKETCGLNVLLEQPQGLLEVLTCEDVAEVMVEADGFFPGSWKETVKACHKAGKQCVLALPAIFRTEAVQYFERFYEALTGAGFDKMLVRSLEEVEWMREKGLTMPMVFDHNLYAYNHQAFLTLREQGAFRQTLPLELNSRELLKRGCYQEELIVYGYLPVMTSAQCVKKTVSGCNRKPELLYLKDRIGKELPVRNHCVFCYNTIYNASPLSLAGQRKMIDRLEVAAVRLQFTMETPEEIRKILRAFADEMIHGKEEEEPVAEFTRGHWKRGVE